MFEDKSKDPVAQLCDLVPLPFDAAELSVLKIASRRACIKRTNEFTRSAAGIDELERLGERMHDAVQAHAFFLIKEQPLRVPRDSIAFFLDAAKSLESRFTQRSSREFFARCGIDKIPSIVQKLENLVP